MGCASANANPVAAAIIWFKVRPTPALFNDLPYVFLCACLFDVQTFDIRISVPIVIFFTDGRWFPVQTVYVLKCVYLMSYFYMCV